MTMSPRTLTGPPISADLLAEIAAFPARREVTHCGTAFTASPFDVYATCPACGTRLKVRSFGGSGELEDVFDAVFAWMARPETAAVARRRAEEVAADEDE